MTSTYYQLALMIAGIGLIVWATAVKKWNAFFALLIAALFVAIFSGMHLADIAASLKKGFGQTMEKIGLLILLGTTLGVILEKTGATVSMANAILRRVNEKNAPAAISIIGFIIGLPIFCDSGFIILNGLNHSLVRKSAYKMPVMAVALATSLYAVHCLVPPHPGITAAVGTAGADIGMVMLFGIALSIPAALFGYFWSIRRRKNMHSADNNLMHEEEIFPQLPSVTMSFLPVILPILLISLKSILLQTGIAGIDANSILLRIVSFSGEPVIALMAGIVSSLFLIGKTNKKEIGHWLNAGVEKAGTILAIIAAGGMFGEILMATGMGKNLGILLSGFSFGIFFPFLIAAILKTAQGSSTVAVITSASIVVPMLGDLGLQSSMGVTLSVLSMGAGSMVISHANDAYFWVISRFSQLDTSVTLRVYSMATLWMGALVQFFIWLLSLFLL
ncbi:GntP family permease [Pollutibacter soli]|uniref:GntP family permease n=1 Tax=Pollutibacter soli TaxID=3034157 RepID=UPI003013B691